MKERTLYAYDIVGGKNSGRRIFYGFHACGIGSAAFCHFDRVLDPIGKGQVIKYRDSGVFPDPVSLYDKTKQAKSGKTDRFLLE